MVRQITTAWKASLLWLRKQRTAFQIIATLVTSLAACFSAYFAYRAFAETQRQANAADEQNRPWLKVVSLSPIQVDHTLPTMLGANFDVQLQNVGHSPALEVFASARLQLDFFERKDDFRFQESFCRQEQSKSDFPGHIIFPGDRGSSFANSIRQVEEIQNDAMKNGIAPRTPLKFEVVGCILYRSPLTNEGLHHTSFLATIYADTALKQPGIDIWQSSSFTKAYPRLETYNGGYAD